MTTFLVEHAWIPPAALVILVLAGPPLGRWLLGHPTLAWAAFAASSVPLGLLTLTPVRRELYARCTVEWSAPTPGRVELAANVVLFVLPVLLAGVALRRPVVALLAGSAASALVEAVQAGVPALGRSCSTNDWLSNTIGAAIGAALASAALAWSQQASARAGAGDAAIRSGRARPRPAHPGRRRRSR